MNPTRTRSDLCAFASVLILGLGAGALSAHASVITDTFTRADNTDLGTTEDASHLPWTVLQNSAKIADDQLDLYGGKSGFGHNSTVLLGTASGTGSLTTVKDLDLTLTIHMTTDSGSNWFGVYYRAQDPDQTAVASMEAYNVQILADGHLKLFDRGGDGQLGSTVDLGSLGTTAHTLRIVSTGARQQIFWDGVSKLDVTDTNSSWGPGAIRLGSFNHQSVDPPMDAFVDDFQLTVVPEPASLMLMGVGGLVLLSRKQRRR